MIYITGDVHGQLDLAKLTMKRFPNQVNLTRSDYLIQLGDLGLLWRNDKTFDYLMDFYMSRKYTLLWIDGNHENFDMLETYPVETWNGGKVHRISDNIIHLMRGQVFNIAGYTFLSLGGGHSIDISRRKLGVDYWQQEEITYKDLVETYANLNKYQNTVDYVLTHSAPSVVIDTVNDISNYYDRSSSEKLLDNVYSNIIYKKWYVGHYHIDHDNDRFSFVYDRIIPVAS